MQDTAKKYPKGWEMFVEDLPLTFREWRIDEKGNKIDYVDFNEVELIDLFGYFVLEFFPKHGIEIERFIWKNIREKTHVKYYIKMLENDNEISFFVRGKTPQEAIDKAFEILERKLEE